MTNLTNVSPASVYGDIITCTNNGGGLSSSLQNIQDGLGNNSAIQLSTTTFNVTGTFQVGGVTFAPTLQYTSGNLNITAIQGMNAASVQVIAAPASGFMNIIQSFAIELIYGGSAAANGGAIYLQYGTGAANAHYATPIAGIPAAFVTGTTVNAAIATTGQINATTGLATSICGNSIICITNASGAFTGGGTSSINYYITYITVPIT